MNVQAQTNTLSAPAIVVFGRDESGKPHASSFPENEVALAEKAAGLMGMRLLPISTDAERALAAKVPKGRVFASGKGFVPFIKATLFAELQAAAPRQVAQASNDAAEPHQGGRDEPSAPTPEVTTGATPLAAEGTPPAKQPGGWGDIEVGAIVLAAAPPRYFDWHECLVLAVEGDNLTLRYCDWPDEPHFTRRAAEVGLMHPTHQPEQPAEPAQLT